MNTSLTTKTGKAKCLNYRNGQRCGRVAKYEVSYQDATWHHVSVCKECLSKLQERCVEVTVMQKSANGFTVNGFSFWPVSRTYVGIE